MPVASMRIQAMVTWRALGGWVLVWVWVGDGVVRVRVRVGVGVGVGVRAKVGVRVWLTAEATRESMAAPKVTKMEVRCIIITWLGVALGLGWAWA